MTMESLNSFVIKEEEIKTEFEEFGVTIVPKIEKQENDNTKLTLDKVDITETFKINKWEQTTNSEEQDPLNPVLKKQKGGSLSNRQILFIRDHDYLKKESFSLSDKMDRYFFCLAKYCNFKCKQKYQIQKHLDMCKSNFECPLCPFMTNDCHEMVKHNTQHINGKVEVSYWAYLTHINKVKRKCIQCPNCPFTTTDNEAMIKHIDHHQKLLKCDFCDSQFPSKVYLKLHIEKYHYSNDPGSKECDECDEKVVDIKKHKDMFHKKKRLFGKTKRFQVHVPDEPGNFKCDECGEKVFDIGKHKDMLHGERSLLSKLIYQCSYCKVNFVTREEVKRHKEVHHKNEEYKKQVEESGQMNPYKCTDCGLRTPSRMAYMQHVLRGCEQGMAQYLAPPPKR